MPLSAKLTSLAQQVALHNQAVPAEPQIAVLVLSADRRTILEAELRPLSEIAAALAAQQSPLSA